MKSISQKRRLFVMALALTLSLGIPAFTSANSSFSIEYEKSRALLIDKDGIDVGYADYWNTRHDFVVELFFDDARWALDDVQIYLDRTDVLPLPTDKHGKPYFKDFTYHLESLQVVNTDEGSYKIYCPLGPNYQWGQDRSRIVAIHADMVYLQLDHHEANNQLGVDVEDTYRLNQYFDGYNDVWVRPLFKDEDGPYEIEGVTYSVDNYSQWDGSKYSANFETELVHPLKGHFVDSPVAGLTYETPTNEGSTDGSGGFYYFPGEEVTLSLGGAALGAALADQKISPLDIFEGTDTGEEGHGLGDPRVANMARLLQTLDADATPASSISINPETVACLEEALEEQDLDFYSDGQIQDIINKTILCSPDPLEEVDWEVALANLDKTLSGNMFRKNHSRTPELTSSKSKLNIMGVWFPARKANGSAAEIEYYDENGDLIRTADQAKPIVIVYTDEVEGFPGCQDIFGGVSRDDGKTFKRKNLSRTADISSFELEDGTDYCGDTRKPVFQVKGNNILVAWTSKYAKGGKPAYAISADDPSTPDIDEGDGYIYDDPYYKEDIWGVGGPQRSHDYSEDELTLDQVPFNSLQVPHSAVWVARGTIVTQDMINSSKFWSQYTEGDIVWFKPERLTSARRDANQVVVAGNDGAGFAVAWQEDPEGLRPGDGEGPGPGWGGATTNHKTDIWYSYITMADFKKVDTHFVVGGDPQHDLGVLERPKALVPMSLPIRLTDNDMVNSDNMSGGSGSNGGGGTHAYGYEVPGLCESFHTLVNQQGVEKHVCATADGRLLDGDTGASRPTLFLQAYTKKDGTKSAWAVLAYEESKGVGSGNPGNDGDGSSGENYKIRQGKNVIYHTFDFQDPSLVSGGSIINLPKKEVDADGNVIGNISYVADSIGNPILDWQGNPQLAYENARRPRIVLQGKSAMGNSRTIMLILYKEGQDGRGRPSDIMLRRAVVPTTDKGTDNPYRPENILCDAEVQAANGMTVCVDGVQNVSSVYPDVIVPSQGEPESDDPWGAEKVVKWSQSGQNLADGSFTNPRDDARAHRGALIGDFVTIGYTYTPNWGAARNGNDKYDFFVRRSFDGGQEWTTDPAGEGVEHCKTWTDPETKEKWEECKQYPAGEFEEARNLSQLPNNKESVIEPRIVKTPGTIKVDGVWTGIAEDKQNKNVFYVSFGTSTNPKKDSETGEREESVPMDIWYSFTQDRGENYMLVEWVVNPDSDGNNAGETIYRWDYLAKGDPEQGEAQLRMTPSGERLYATWLEEGLYDGVYGSDIWFRRVMSQKFKANRAPTE